MVLRGPPTASKRCSSQFQQHLRCRPQADQTTSHSSCSLLYPMQGKEGRTETEKQREGKATGLTKANWRETDVHPEGSSPSCGHGHVPGLVVTWWQVGVQVCGLPRCRLLLGTSPGRCLRWGGSEASPLNAVLMRRVPIVLWHFILPQKGQNVCHLQAFSTQVSGVGMTLLGHCTSPNFFTPYPSHMESREVYNSAPRPRA